jgi:hypothetical protein
MFLETFVKEKVEKIGRGFTCRRQAKPRFSLQSLKSRSPPLT